MKNINNNISNNQKNTWQNENEYNKAKKKKEKKMTRRACLARHLRHLRQEQQIVFENLIKALSHFTVTGSKSPFKQEGSDSLSRSMIFEDD